MNRQQRTILVIDDSATDRELYRRYLLRDREYRYTFVEAELGQEGWALWQRHQPDVVLLDYQLPDLDGLEWLDLLPGQRQPPCWPIIIVTGQGNEEIAVQAIKAGAQEYLLKQQMTPESLRLAVNRAIKAVQLSTQLQQRVERDRLVSQITHHMHQSLDLDKILQTIVVEVRQFLQTDRVVVLRLQSEGWGTVTTESVGTEWMSLCDTSLHDPCLNEGYIASFAGSVIVKPDIHDGSIEPCHVELLAKLQVRASLVVPIVHADRLWGMLIAHHCAAPRQWQALEIDLLKELAIQVGITLQQAELYRQAQTELAERQQAEAALQQAHDLLQQRVTERTAALVQTNLQLHQEIDRHQHTEAILRQQQEFLSSIYEGTEQAIFVVDITAEGDFRYVSFNPVAERYTGLTNAWLQGKTPEAAFGAALGAKLRHNYELCRRSGTSITYEEQLDFAASSIIWTLTTLSPLRNELGQIYRIIGTAIDISDRKHKEDILRNIALGVSAKTGEAFFQALVEYLTKALRVEYAFIGELVQPDRDRVSMIVGYGNDRVLENSEYALADTPCEHVINRQFYVCADRVQQQFPLDLLLVDFQAQSYLGVVLLDSAGQALGLISVLSCQPLLETQVMTEILTIFAARVAAELERQQAELTLQLQKQELARSNEELQQFAYVASHDLQEPLRMITSYLELLEHRYQGQLDAKADTFIAYAVDGATRMQALINDLLSYSRVGRRGQQFQSVDCDQILQTVLIDLQVAIDQSQAKISADTLPQVQADPVQMSQLFQNLISNAIKFRRQEPPQVYISLQPTDGKWLFSVRDNGIGIEKKYSDRIFIIFQRLHSKTEYPGTGIGLAVCKKIVERHGGNIWVESQPGRGSTFYFTLPHRSGNP
jgi:PAS domain S-box-containing protein